MDDRSRQPLDALIADLLDQELMAELLTTYDDLSLHTPLVSPSPPLPLSQSSAPHYLGRFEIVRELGRGGGGIVFLAFDPQLHRNVALKVPHPEVLVHRELRKRFVGEAQAAAGLKHQNIVPVYEAGEIGPICYIASEYCEGPTLAAWLKGREAPVDARLAAELVATLADAVEHAHRQGILHRDLKPSNVLLANVDRTPCVTWEGEALAEPIPQSVQTLGRSLALPAITPKLTDFGLAKALERDKDVTHTRTTAMVGTPAYMSPEQAESRNADIGPATDVYALGVILYELLTGQTPFNSDSDIKLLQAIASPEPPVAPRRIRRELPRDLEAICLMCLEKEATQRYASAVTLADDLRRFLDWRPTVARPNPVAARVWKWARRRPAWAALAAVMALTPLALGAGVLLHDHRVERVETTASAKLEARNAAERERTRRHDYASHIQGAYQAWQNADLKSAMALLDRCRPVQGQDDLRGWEWYYVRRLCAGGILTLRGNDGPVRGVAFSTDGCRLASCDADGMLRIWDVLNGRSLATLKAHEGGANAVAYSRDGSLLATVGDDGYLRLWNAETYRLDAELKESAGRVGDVAKQIGGSGTPQRAFPTEAEERAKLHCVAFARDGKYLAAAGDDRVIRVWNVATRKRAATLEGHTDTIHSVAYSPTDSMLASGSADRTARIWNLYAPNENPAVLDCASPVASVAFSPDGRTLAVADPQIRLWEVASRIQRPWVATHQSPIHSLAYSTDGNTVACAALDTTVATWDVASTFPVARQDRVAGVSYLQRRHTYRGHTRAALCVAYSAQGDRLASGGKDGVIQIWDPAKPQDRYPLEDAGDRVDCAAFSPYGDTLAVSSSAGTSSQVTFWNLLTREPSTSFTLPEDSHAGSIAYSPDGKRMAFTISSQPFLIRDLIHEVNRPLAELSSVGACAFSPDSRMLAVVLGGDNSTRILDASTGEVRASVQGQRSVAFSPDGRLLATESSQVDQFYRVELWDVRAGRTAARLAGHTAEIDSIAFSADSECLVTGSADGTARLWNVEQRAERWVLRGHRGAVTKVAFLMNQRSLATASADGTVKIWDVDTGRQLLSLDVVEGLVSTMAASADGRTLATISKKADGARRVELWSAPSE